MSEGKFEIRWVSRGRPPRVAPNPDYPKGMDIDISLGAERTCTTPLPYPTGRKFVGTWMLKCLVCGLRVGITAASRPDDPKSVKLACRLAAAGRAQ